MRVIALLGVIVGVVSALNWDSLQETRSSQCNCGWVNKGRIVGGKETSKNEYPFVAALESIFGRQFCGGTILTQWHIITAAHCTVDEKAYTMKVRVGAHDLRLLKWQGTVHKVARIIQHEKYDDKKVMNDISLLLLKTPIKFDQNVGPACLPAIQSNLVGQTLKALGWGAIRNKGPSSSVLLGVDLKVVSQEECARKWAGGLYPSKGTTLCTFEVSKDTCQGDSGGPLVWLNPTSKRYSLVALVSYGGACAGPLPGVNTDVAGFLDWINKNIAESKPGAAACTKG